MIEVRSERTGAVGSEYNNRHYIELFAYLIDIKSVETSQNLVIVTS